MNKILKTIYDSPKVGIVELEVEQGFAVSGGEWYNEDSVEREDISNWY